MLNRIRQLWRKATTALPLSNDKKEMVLEASPPPLGGTVRDHVVTVATKGVAGMIPVVGSIFSELVGTVIPQQRIERLEAYVRYLTDRLVTVDEALLRERLKREEYIELFEDGAFQSVRALSDERRRQIAEMVASGISGTEKERIETKRLLKILDEIDDDQIIMLTSYLEKNQRNKEFIDKHRTVLEAPPYHVNSSPEELERCILHTLSQDELLKLGLLRQDYAAPRRGELPEFDHRTGMMKAGYRHLSALGRLFLRRIGVASKEDL